MTHRHSAVPTTAPGTASVSVVRAAPPASSNVETATCFPSGDGWDGASRGSSSAGTRWNAPHGRPRYHAPSATRVACPSAPHPANRLAPSGCLTFVVTSSRMQCSPVAALKNPGTKLAPMASAPPGSAVLSHRGSHSPSGDHERVST